MQSYDCGSVNERVKVLNMRSFGISIVMGITIGAVLVFARVPSAPLIAGAVITPLVYVSLLIIEKLMKDNTKQQTQIDDLKRELEEVKGKMKE